MMKSFIDCSPQGRTLIIWAFIFLTLLYLFFLIYEGNGRKEKNSMMAKGILFVAYFFVTSGLCVGRRIFQGDQVIPIIVRLPFMVLVGMVILGLIFTEIQIYEIYKDRKTRLRENAIQESLDNLPTGIGFFDKNGMPKLMNRRMYGICRTLAGRDIQNDIELKAALRNPFPSQAVYDSNFGVYCFKDGSIWKISEEAVTVDEEKYHQFLASEVSELYRSKLLLEQENQKLQEMATAMKELSRNVAKLTREEETLRMKMRIHDKLGYSVLRAKRMLMGESEGDEDDFLIQWKQTLHLINKDNESMEREESQGLVRERAGALGVEVFYIYEEDAGRKWQETHLVQVMDEILLEALSNCVKHGEAKKLYVKLEERHREWICKITDDGHKAVRKIKEGGGLFGIKKKVEAVGGTLKVCGMPEFSMTIIFPKEVAE